jgi:hypothetical protein
VISSIAKSLIGVNLELAEREMLDYDQADVPVYHHFGPGVYVREIRMKAGTLAIGHKQRQSQLNIMISGKVEMIKDDCTEMATAPLIYTGGPGQKIGYIVEDTVWLNVFPNPDEERDIDVLEERLLDKSDSFVELQKTEDRSMEREDYLNFVSSSGLSEETIRSQSENEDDQIPMSEYYSTRVSVRDSDIEGRGLFANGDIVKDECISLARMDGRRTIAGRYTNHSPTPNCVFVKDENSNIYLYSLEDISGCKGGGKGTELTVDYRNSLRLAGIEMEA